MALHKQKVKYKRRRSTEKQLRNELQKKLKVNIRDKIAKSINRDEIKLPDCVNMKEE